MATEGPTTDAAAETSFNVLVVDDVEANREVLGRRLTRRGYAVAEAEDGPTALAKIAAGDFDLILLDVMMPGMSGLEVLTEIRKTRGPTDLPVVMATAKDQSEDVVTALNLGANDYVTKPLDFAVVMARVQSQLALRRSVKQVVELQQNLSARNADLETLNEKLSTAYNRINADLQAAAEIQTSYLPTKLPKPRDFDFAWDYEPCEYLAGDFLNVCQLDADHIGLYVLDVSGHGVSAALLAVAAARAMAPAPDPDSLLIRATSTGGFEPVPPAEVADRLNQKFNWDANPGQFITLFYGLLNTRTGRLSYVSAGHPPTIVVHADGSSDALVSAGLPIGIASPYTSADYPLRPGDRVYAYSDGVTETMNPDAELFGIDRLTEALVEYRDQPLADSLKSVAHALRAWRGEDPIRDDTSLLGLLCKPTARFGDGEAGAASWEI